MQHRMKMGRDHAAGWRSSAKADVARPVVLIESEDPAEAQVLWRHLELEGYDAVWCSGPEEGGPGRCLLVTAGHCPLMDEADVVLATWPSTAAHRQVLGAEQQRYPGTPVIVTASPRVPAESQGPFDGHQVLCRHASVETVLGAVNDALGRQAS